jgi:predicted DNA-binding transcriptional regulator YafY
MASDDSRFGRLEELLDLALELQGSLGGVALPDVMERYEVSRRTASRMLGAVRRAIGEADFESFMDGHGHKRWRLTRPKVNGLFRLNADELAALHRAERLAEREGDASLARDMADIGHKLRALSPPDWLLRVDPDLEAMAEAQGFAFRAGPRPRIDEGLVEQLRHAMLTQKRVKLRHAKSPDDRPTWQSVGPLGFLFGSRHYLVAWSERRRHVVLFRLSRIDRVEVLDDAFDAPEDFDLDAFARRSFGVFQEDPVDVAWRFVPRAAAEARECVFHPDQTIEDRPDGSIVVRFRAGGLQEMAWHLFTWGRDVEVLEPAALRRELTRWLAQGVSRHAGDVDGTLGVSQLKQVVAHGVAKSRPAKPAKTRRR